MHPVLFTLEFAGQSRLIGSYGICLGLAILLAGGLTARAAARARLDVGAVVAVSALSAGAGLLGARMVFGLVTALQGGSKWEVLNQHGLVFYGGLCGALLGLALAAPRLSLPVAGLLDLAAPAACLGHALGRLGCFLGGCCFGAPHGGPLSVTYLHPLAPAAQSALSRHPLPLYEMAGLLLLALWLWRGLDGRAPARAGGRFVAYAFGYALLRLVLEPLRGDALRGLYLDGRLSTSQLVAGLVILACLLWWRQGPANAGLRGWRLPAFGFVLLLVLGAGLHLPAAADAGPRARLGTQARVAVSGGWFSMGSDDEGLQQAASLCRALQLVPQPGACKLKRFELEQPQRSVYLARYRIDRTEVSQRAYRSCVSASVCTPSSVADDDLRIGHGSHPAVGVNHAQARRYCDWVGGHLPTEAQWERAARGLDGRVFPWGRFFNSRLANYSAAADGRANTDGYEYAAPVGAYADSTTAHGLLNMAGNAWELTADFMGPYAGERVRDPRGPSQGEERVIRGGSWRSAPHTLRTTARAAIPLGARRTDVGFRCAYNVP